MSKVRRTVAVVVIVLFLFCLPIVATAQDETTKPKTVYELLRQVSGEEYKPVVIDWSEIQRHIADTSFWFDISCDMLTLPGPLTTAEATITLTSTADAADILARDYDLRVTPSTTNMEWLGDTSFVWRGPRDKGAMYSIPIRFTPLVSGHQSFTIELRYPNGPRRWELLMRVAWCLDEAGNVLYLRNTRCRPGSPCPFHPVGTAFFDKDSVVIRQHIGRETDRYLFSSRYTITPPLQIGDTSTIRYYLTPNRDMPEGIDYRFSTVYMNIVRLPESLVDRATAAGETIELSVDVVPAAVRNVQAIDLTIGKLFKSHRADERQAVECEAIFNDDGSLRYIYTRGLGDVDDSLYPKTFPEAATKGAWRSRLFRKDGPPPDSTDLR